jgi:hypothetical protein
MPAQTKPGLENVLIDAFDCMGFDAQKMVDREKADGKAGGSA